MALERFIWGLYKTFKGSVGLYRTLAHMNVCINMCAYIYIYIYIYMCERDTSIYTHECNIYIYIYICMTHTQNMNCCSR